MAGQRTEDRGGGRHLSQIEHGGGDVIAPLVLTLRTLLLDLPVSGQTVTATGSAEG